MARRGRTRTPGWKRSPLTNSPAAVFNPRPIAFFQEVQRAHARESTLARAALYKTPDFHARYAVLRKREMQRQARFQKLNGVFDHSYARRRARRLVLDEFRDRVTRVDSISLRRRLLVCAGRALRRQVLFAQGNGGVSRKRMENVRKPESKIRCK